MGSREARTGLLALGAAALIGGCGSEADFANEERPPAPIVVTAKVDEEKVVISPDKFGAGLVNITVSNQSPDPIQLSLTGPSPKDRAESGEIPPGGVGNLKAEMSQGDYEISGGDRSDARPAEITVGPPRKSSKDELLLP